MSIANGWTSQNTILDFGLTKWQIDRLRDFSGASGEQKVKIYIADKITDLYAVPHFLAILNFSGLSQSQEGDYFAFWQACISSRVLKKAEIMAIDDLELAKEIQQSANMPLTFVMNCSINAAIADAKLIVNRDVFAETEQLKLLVLAEMKSRNIR